MTLKRFGVIIEGQGAEYSAYVPDLPGCIGAGNTMEDTRRDIEQAVAAHVQFLLREGETIPEPRDIVPVDVSNASVLFVEVEIPDPQQQIRA